MGNCYIEKLKKMVCDCMPFNTTSNSNKPSHVANNLFRLCLGKKSKIKSIYSWLNVSSTRDEISKSKKLLDDYKELFDKNTNVNDIKYFRTMLHEIFNQDNTAYGSEDYSCVTSTSEFTVKGTVPAEQKVGDFIYGILKCKINGKESPAISLIRDALKDKKNAFSTLIIPLCDGILQEEIIDEFKNENHKLNEYELIIRDAFDCLADNLVKLNMSKNSIMLLQRMVSLSDFCALFYLININNVENDSITPIVFDSGINSNSIVRSSHESYVLAKKNIENFFVKKIYEELNKSIDNTDIACINRINDMPIENDDHNVKRNMLMRLYKNKLSENNDYLECMARALQEIIYTYEFKNCTPSDFLSTCLGVRNGVIGPKGGNATRRFYPEKFFIENLILSSIDYDDLIDGIEYSEFGKILFDKFSIIVGINNDLESNILDEYGIKKITPGDLVGDLHKNSLAFADIIISLGYGKKYADGVTMIGCEL